jgi:citrate lyase beta subunit
MRHPKDFYAPLAVGAPQPLRSVPARPSRVIHFFDPSNPKMAAKIPEMVGSVDVLLGNLEDAVKADNKEAARAGLVQIGKSVDFGDLTQLWTRVNSLDSPWVLDDLTTLVTEIGDKLDVIMVPKVQGPEDIHYVDRLLAQLEARAGLTRSRSSSTRSSRPPAGVANVEEICAASPRMQGLSLGPADLAADRRMKTTRVGGGHPGYLVRQDPVNGDISGPRTAYQQDLWHYTIARMVDACASTGSSPTTARSATSRTSSPVRTSSATPSCSGASAPGRCTRCRSASPRRSSARPRRCRARAAGRRRDGRRHRRRHARRQDGGRRQPQAVPGHDRTRRAARQERPRARQLVCRRRRRRRNGLMGKKKHAGGRWSATDHGIPAASVGALHALLQRAGAGEGQDHPV